MYNYQRTFPVDQFGNKFVQNDLGKYLDSTPEAPKDIENRKAYFVGGGIANLIGAAFLIRDAQMPGENITFLEQSDVSGGSFDGAGNNEDGFIARGGREMGQHFECFWDIMKDVPAIEMPAPHSVLDEFRKYNENDPNVSLCRIISQQATKRQGRPSMGLSKRSQFKIVKLLMAKEEKTYYKTIEDWFDKDFFESNFYTLWRSMFAFQNYQSLTEMKRYMHRFLQYLPGFPDFSCLRFSRYNQYTSFIQPLEKYLKDKGVRFEYRTTVHDLDILVSGRSFEVQGIELTREGKKDRIEVRPQDIVIVTNGSLTESTGYGDMNTPAEFKKTPGPAWSLWQNIAKKVPNCGKPDVFCSDPEKTVWQSVSFNFYGGYDNPFNQKLRELSQRDLFSGKTVTAGIITSDDSPWLCSLTVHRQPQFPGQQEGLCVAWAYGLLGWEKGTVTNKPMFECTGEEVLREFCYHFGVTDVDKVISMSKVRLATMPFITSEFTPRGEGDRPWPVPEGSKNLGFTGQFVETPDDCVFTTEGSARTAQMAVYGLLGLERDIQPIWPTQYDIRSLLHSASAMGDGKLPGEKLLRRLLKGTYYENIIPRGR
ncbi:oleate hydratase [Corynebacterium poyangense]|uniref:Oleate hydratase n=1 Tax=Corynebacterium poyangense TaxID=2684405 RepID=A0A7H0SN09_9CORY|nr:oleate hydratase [Corynebacterium poyangense]QNQ89934.1 oleate hydratase [Corynebacterium poyangense]